MDASRGGSGVPVVGLPATEIAARVAAGELSAVDVLRAHVAHIDAVQPRIGAFRVVRRKAALAEAAAVDAAPRRSSMPLAGVPVAVKDNVAVAGETCTVGSTAWAPAPAEEDHSVVARLKAAGAVVVGITRVPELCLYGTTDGPGWVARNPWNTALSPAGSSGGSAAAVASGCVPVAHGNDGLGSLRLPAASCGLVTLKPGRGVVPAQLGAIDGFGMAENGALATTVADLALVTAVMAGEQPGWLSSERRPLRIDVSTRSPLAGARPDAPALAAVDTVVALLVAAGHTVVRRDPAAPVSAAAGTLARWLAAADADVEQLELDRSALQPRSRTHARLGSLVRRTHLVRPGRSERFRAQMTRFFADVDLVLTPVTNGPPLPARPWHERSFLANVTANARWAPWVSPWNLAGLPALVLPAGRRLDGLPVAVQIAGPLGAERRLLWLAEELEHRQPWPRHAPVFAPPSRPPAERSAALSNP